MAEQVCYLCSQTKPVLKLFAKCQHESACYDCLRRRYIEEPSNTAAAVCYPLKCFHPECNRRLTTNQIKPLTKKDEELATFYRLSTAAKVYRYRLGADWKELWHIIEALGGVEMCKCPGCGILITKQGGCNHMNCIMCQQDFDWEDKHIAMLYSLDQVVKKQTSQQAAKTTRGALQPWLKYHDGDYNDDFTPDDEDIYIECENDTTAGEKVNHHSNIATDSVIPPQVLSTCNDNTTTTTTTVASHLIPTSPCVDENSTITSFEILSSENDDYFDILDCDESSQQQQDEEETYYHRCSVPSSSSSSSSWEEVSDVASVRSIDSRRSTFTFADIARANKGAWKTALVNTTKLVPKVNPKIDEQQPSTSSRRRGLEVHHHDDYEDDTKFDSYFDYDGAKRARGGKGKYMFNRQHARKYPPCWDRPSYHAYEYHVQRYRAPKFPASCYYR